MEKWGVKEIQRKKKVRDMKMKLYCLYVILFFLVSFFYFINESLIGNLSDEKYEVIITSFSEFLYYQIKYHDVERVYTSI